PPKHQRVIHIRGPDCWRVSALFFFLLYIKKVVVVSVTGVGLWIQPRAWLINSYFSVVYEWSRQGVLLSERALVGWHLASALGWAERRVRSPTVRERY